MPLAICATKPPAGQWWREDIKTPGRKKDTGPLYSSRGFYRIAGTDASPFLKVGRCIAYPIRETDSFVINPPPTSRDRILHRRELAWARLLERPDAPPLTWLDDRDHRLGDIPKIVRGRETWGTPIVATRWFPSETRLVLTLDFLLSKDGNCFSALGPDRLFATMPDSVLGGIFKLGNVFTHPDELLALFRMLSVQSSTAVRERLAKIGINFPGGAVSLL